MILEEQRVLHEDIERLEQAIADRVTEEPKHIRDRLRRDHEVANFLQRIHDQSERLLTVYNDADGARAQEIQKISTGDPFAEFNKQLADIKDFHRRYPNEPVENIASAYKRRPQGEGNDSYASAVENMFTGEEGYGRFFDLTSLHEDFLNLRGVKGTRRVTYLQYLDTFDTFTPPQCPVKKPDKLTDAYFHYIGSLALYLEEFMRKTRPLEDLDKTLAAFDMEFEEAWDKGKVPGWEEQEANKGPSAPVTEGTGEGIWCADCQKEFKNENVYKHHLPGRQHVRAAKQRTANGNGAANGFTPAPKSNVQQMKEKAVAEREFRVKRLASAMQTQRTDTRTNVERKQGMTERERQQELEALYANSPEAAGGQGGGGGGGDDDDDSESEGEDRIYNPLKLPLAWDGKPIPFWLYKLHGLGVEFACEICGNFVYMGRRAFDKHFGEARHVYGLKCLGITGSWALFREITGIEDAVRLWGKMEEEKRKEGKEGENVIQMEDSVGNVMPEKVYLDLAKQGLL